MSKEIINQKKKVSLVSPDMDNPPNTTPFVTFFSEKDSQNPIMRNYVVHIMAVVPYEVKEENISIQEQNERIVSFDRKKRIKMPQIVIAPPKGWSPPKSQKIDHDIKVYYIEITFSVERLGKKFQRVFVFFKDLNNEVMMPTTSRGTVVTTGSPR